MTPEEFYAHALTLADADGRLPIPDQAGWEIFPFAAESLDDDMAAEMGRLIVRLDRAVRALPGIERTHINKWGDGGAHLHVFVLGRPSGLMQLRGSNLALWDDMLPPMPEDAYAADLAAVAAALS